MKEAQQLGGGSRECDRQLCVMACVSVSSLWTPNHGALVITRTVQSWKSPLEWITRTTTFTFLLTGLMGLL